MKQKSDSDPSTPEAVWDRYTVPTYSGKLVHLLKPDPATIDEHDIAMGLAKAARFSGQTHGIAYSVAQHSIIGADILYRRHGRPAAAAFILHDGHEAYIGDETPMYVQSLSALLDDIVPGAGASVAVAVHNLKHGLDSAIHTAFGLPLPWPDEIQTIVKDMDYAMARAERQCLVTPTIRAWNPLIEHAEDLGLDIVLMNTMTAYDSYLDRLKFYVE